MCKNDYKSQFWTREVQLKVNFGLYESLHTCKQYCVHPGSIVFQMGMGGDHRASHPGAHVRQPHHRGVCVGPAARSQNVSPVSYLLAEIPTVAQVQSSISPSTRYCPVPLYIRCVPLYICPVPILLIQPQSVCRHKLRYPPLHRFKVLSVGELGIAPSPSIFALSHSIFARSHSIFTLSPSIFTLSPSIFTLSLSIFTLSPSYSTRPRMHLAKQSYNSLSISIFCVINCLCFALEYVLYF